MLLADLFQNCNNAVQLEKRFYSLDGQICGVICTDKVNTVPLEKITNEVEMAKYLELVCSAFEACPKLITLEDGPDQCDNCLKQREKENAKSKSMITKDTRPGNVAARHEEKVNGNSAKQQQIKSQTPKLLAEVNSAEKAKRLLQPTKRRRPSDADTESSTSLSSTSSGTIRHFSKMPKKDNGSTETSTMQAQTVTTTSISSKSTQSHFVHEPNEHNFFLLAISSYEFTSGGQ